MRVGIALAVAATSLLLASAAHALAADGAHDAERDPSDVAPAVMLLTQELRILPDAGIVRLDPLVPPRPVPAKLAEDELRQRLEPDAAGSGLPMAERRSPGHSAAPAGAGRELRLQMREYGERYGEASRERHENMAPSTARWLTDAERFQFREALRERYRQHR